MSLAREARAEQPRVGEGVILGKRGNLVPQVDLMVRSKRKQVLVQRVGKYNILIKDQSRRSRLNTPNGATVSYRRSENGCLKKRVLRLLRKLNAYNGSLYSCSPNWEVKALATAPNDTYWWQLWALHNTGSIGSGGSNAVAGIDMNVLEAWDVTQGDTSLVVGVIDTGVQPNHPDIQARMWRNLGETPNNGIDDDNNGVVDDSHGFDAIANSGYTPTTQDGNGHGTHVAGTIAATGNNGIGVVGVAPNVQIMALKFMDANGSGLTSGAIACIDYANDRGVTITNNSWGGGGFSQPLANEIDRSRSLGYLFVAAAGNSNQNIDSTPSYPASYNLDNILSVAAVHWDGSRASFSNYGAVGVDIGAPGTYISSTYPTSTYATLQGTSMAAPNAAGVAALLKSCNPSLTGAQIRTIMMQNGTPLASMTGTTASGSMVNAQTTLANGCSVGGGGGGGGGGDSGGGDTPAPTPTPTPPSTYAATLPQSIVVGQNYATIEAPAGSRLVLNFGFNEDLACPFRAVLKFGSTKTSATLRFNPKNKVYNFLQMYMTVKVDGTVEALASSPIAGGQIRQTIERRNKHAMG